jgi:hypothetical protein
MTSCAAVSTADGACSFDKGITSKCMLTDDDDNCTCYIFDQTSADGCGYVDLSSAEVLVAGRPETMGVVYLADGTQTHYDVPGTTTKYSQLINAGSFSEWTTECHNVANAMFGTDSSVKGVRCFQQADAIGTFATMWIAQCDQQSCITNI